MGKYAVGTVGGAIYGNAHWKKINIGDLIERAAAQVTGRCSRRRPIAWSSVTTTAG
jgi:hypothetical protein